MAESLWLFIGVRKSAGSLIVSRRVDNDGLQAFAADVGACDPDIVEVRVYPLASERTVTFRGSILGAIIEEHKERAELARLKANEPAVHSVYSSRVVLPPPQSVGEWREEVAGSQCDTIATYGVVDWHVPAGTSIRFEAVEKFGALTWQRVDPAAAVVGVPGPVAVGSAGAKPVVVIAPPDSASGGYIVPHGETPYEVASRINADPDSPFTAVVVDGAVRLHQVVRGASIRVVTPEDAPGSPPITYPEIPKPDAPGVKFYEPSPDGVAFLASMAHQVRPSLSMASCRAAARELYHKLGGYSTARAADAVADRAALLDAGIPSALIVGGPVAAPYCFSAPVPGYVTSAGEEKSRP